MMRGNTHSTKHAILAAFASVLLVTAALGFGQDAKQDRANVLLRFAKDGTVSASCSETIGLITQSMFQLDGVKNAKIDAKNNGIQVSYDPAKTTPEKIVAAFNKENPDRPLQPSNAKQAKQLSTSYDVKSKCSRKSTQ